MGGRTRLSTNDSVSSRRAPFRLSIELPPSMAKREEQEKTDAARRLKIALIFPMLYQILSDLYDEVSLLAPAKTRKGHLLIGVCCCSAAGVWICATIELSRE